MERMQSIANVRLQSPVFPKDFAFDGNNRTQIIVNNKSIDHCFSRINFLF
jgi:hypothetical protein